jgi:predicted Zn-dependent peptidase
MVKTYVYKNGLTLCVDTIKCLSSVACVFRFRVGAANESDKNSGITHFLEHMIFNGTETKNEEQIRKELSRLRTTYNGLTSVTNTEFYIKNPKQSFDKAFEIFSDMLCNTYFDEKTIEKEKKVILDEM